MATNIFVDMPGGQKMPAIGIGTWMANSDSELINALNTAVEVGYRHIDTAFVYFNETIIGEALKKLLSSGKVKREELFITTKLPLFGVHEDKVEMFIKKSLENLQLDYLDLYLIHFPVGSEYHEDPVEALANPLKTVPTDHIAIWKKMEEQVDAGRTKAIGLSNFNAKQIAKIMNTARIKPACLQVELHVFLQQRELVDFCHDNGMVVVAYSPLGSPGYNKFLETCGKEGKNLPDMLHNPVVKRIAKKHNKSNGQIMLRYLIQRNIVPIPKSVTPSRIKENIDVFDFSLDSDDMEDLNDLEVGEDGRVCDFNFFPGLEEHPEWPFPK